MARNFLMVHVTCCGVFFPEHSSFFHNSRLIRWIQQNKIYKKFRDLTRNWTWIACLTVRHLNHYTTMFSVLVWGCNWILFMHGWFCPIRLIHLIGQKSLHFEKNRLCFSFSIFLRQWSAEWHLDLYFRIVTRWSNLVVRVDRHIVKQKIKSNQKI